MEGPTVQSSTSSLPVEMYAMATCSAMMLTLCTVQCMVVAI